MYDDLRELNYTIQKKQEHIDELRAALTSLSAPIGVVVQSSHSDRIASLTCKVIAEEKALDKLIDKYADMKHKAAKEIFTLKNEEWQEILFMHYLEYKSLGEIAAIKGKTAGAIKLMNNRALKKLKKTVDVTR